MAGKRVNCLNVLTLMQKNLKLKCTLLKMLGVIVARCYASAVLAMGLCLSVCHKLEFYYNG